MSGSPSWTLPLALALGIATVAVFSLRKRRSTCSEEQRGVVLTALKELARRFFPVCQDLASIAKTVRTKMKATHVLIPEETLQEQLLRQCQVFEKLQHIQHEVAEEYGISEEELQSLQEATQDEEVQSYTAGFRSMLDEALQGSSPVLPNVKIPELLTKEMALKIWEESQSCEAKEALKKVKGNRCSLKELGEVLNAAHKKAWQQTLKNHVQIVGENGSEVTIAWWHSTNATRTLHSKELS